MLKNHEKKKGKRQAEIKSNVTDNDSTKMLSSHGYIPDQYYRQRDPRYPEKNERRKRKNLFTQEDFQYDKNNDIFICPVGKILKADGKNIKYHEYRGNRYKAIIADCENCLKKAKCIKKGGKKEDYLLLLKVKIKHIQKR